MKIGGHQVLRVNFELRYKTTLRVLDRRTRIVEAIAQQGDQFEFSGDGAAIARYEGARRITLDPNRLWYQADGRLDQEIEEARVRDEVGAAARALADVAGNVEARRVGARLMVHVKMARPNELQASVLESAREAVLFSGALAAQSGERVRRAELAYEAGPEQRAVRWHLGDDGLVADVDCGVAQPEPPYVAVLDTVLAFAEAVVSSVQTPGAADSEATE